LLEGPLVEVAGILASSPGGDGSAASASLVAVPVGAGALLKDLRVYQGFPNVVLEARPHVGSNDGFIVAKARTHNNCGIAAGTELCADFGERHTLGCAEGYSQGAKRFRGVLDTLFKKQRGDGGDPVAGASVPEPIDVGGGVGPEGPAPGGGDNAPPADSCFEVVPLADAFGLQLKAASASNKKVNPKTVLRQWAVGAKIDEPGDGVVSDFRFTFPKPRSAQVVMDGAVRNLGDVIVEKRIDTLYQHAKFDRGIPPAAFAPTKKTWHSCRPSRTRRLSRGRSVAKVGTQACCGLSRRPAASLRRAAWRSW
jgi:hypothetical protein